MEMDILSAARVGNLSALRDAIKRGDDVNSKEEVSWFVVVFLGFFINCTSRIDVQYYLL